MKPEIVFVIGAGRSGTTLLMNMLDQHSEIIAPPEHDFLISGIHKFGKKKRMTHREIARFVNNMWNRKTEFKRIWNLNEDQLKKELLEEDQNFNSLFIKIMSSYNPNKLARVIIDKNPYYTANVDLLINQFPEAKFIAVVRDVRDRLVSIKKNESKVFRNNILRSAKWSDFNEEILELESSGRAPVSIVKYERLISQPKETLSILCDFLGLSYENGLMNYSKKARMSIESSNSFEKGLNKMHKSSNEELNTKKIGEWRTALSEKEKIDLSCFCGETGVKLGYSDFVKLTDDEIEEIKKNYNIPMLKGKMLWSLKGASYRLPFWVQRLLSKSYRKLLSK